MAGCFASNADDGGHREPLCEDGEEDDAVGDGQEEVVIGVVGEGECHGDGDSAAEAAPGEDGDGAGVEAAEGAQGGDDAGDAEPAGEEGDEDGEDAGEEESGGEGHDEDLQADEHEEDSVEDFVDEFPEGVEVLFGFFGHGEVAALVADEEAGDDDGDGGGDVGGFSAGVAAHGEGEGEEDFDLVVVDALEKLVGGDAGDKSEEDAAGGFAEEEEGDLMESDGAWVCEHVEEGEEEDDADAVVEEGFTGDLGFEGFGGVGLFHDAQDGDGVGGGDE